MERDNPFILLFCVLTKLDPKKSCRKNSHNFIIGHIFHFATFLMTHYKIFETLEFTEPPIKNFANELDQLILNALCFADGYVCINSPNNKLTLNRIQSE